VGFVKVKEGQVEGEMVAADTLTYVRELAWSAEWFRYLAILLAGIMSGSEGGCRGREPE
jgi:hypothetical protein